MNNALIGVIFSIYKYLGYMDYKAVAYHVVQEYAVESAVGQGVRRVLRNEGLAVGYVGGFLLYLRVRRRG